jgi:hypothetical protein
MCLTKEIKKYQVYCRFKKGCNRIFAMHGCMKTYGFVGKIDNRAKEIKKTTVFYT